MADSHASERLQQMRAGDWTIIRELDSLPESDRRRLLRSHREISIRGPIEIETRRQLDEALDRLMLLELGVETGVIEDRREYFEVKGLASLFLSSSFVRYIDSYLSLSVRFIADRLGVPPDPASYVNELPTGRPCPPAIPGLREADAERAMVDFLTMKQELDARDDDVGVALRFLDGFVADPSEPARFELWLRGLTEDVEDGRLLTIARGLFAFAAAKTRFYSQLEEDSLGEWREAGAAPRTWTAKHPLTARFGLYDLYWVSRLLRADVSPTGAVVYRDGSWLTLLAGRVEFLDMVPGTPTVFDAEEVLHGVLDYTCDLVQNSAEIASDRLIAETTKAPTRPATTLGWRQVYDEELGEIARQRGERQYDRQTHVPAADEDAGQASSPAGKRPFWSRRVRTGAHIDDLVGLALSGGGIRSATFSLGVLQRLQELDLLRRIDYLSTVSGGGYIGAWLLGSVRRSRYWLTTPTDWGSSIAHLRRYSNYLSPRVGLMSADTWTMWGSWIRNAVLIQFSATLWVAVLMLLVGVGGLAFDWSDAFFVYKGVVLVSLVWLTAVIARNLRRETDSLAEGQVLRLAVLPAWIGAYCASSVLWQTNYVATFPDILKTGYLLWKAPLAILVASCFFLSALSVSAEGDGIGRRIGAAIVSLLAALCGGAATYLGVCYVYWLYGSWRYVSEYSWYAYALGPSLLLLSVTAGVLVMIGVLGSASPDWRREWWTRLGSWLGIFGAGFLAVSVGTLFGPLLVLKAIHSQTPVVTWGGALTWLGTVIGGLFAGNSTQPETSASKGWKPVAIRVFARVAAIVFIVGAYFVLATVVHVLLIKIWTTAPLSRDSATYWVNTHRIDIGMYGWSLLALLVAGLLASWRFELNVFGLNQFYRNRLVRCYLGATRWVPGMRKPHRFTGFDAGDDLPLATLRHDPSGDPPYRGPFPIVNCSLNLGGSSDLALHTRHSASFMLTPLRCGSERPSVGFAPTGQPGGPMFAGGVSLGQAISVSGAAASPNMGYDTSPLVAFLLAMFNVRLAWWFPNPGRRLWSAGGLSFGLWYLIQETFGLADEKSAFVNVSDGGHFENLGIYELVRRRCKVIIAVDGECDEKLAFGSLGRVIRMCQTDLGANISLDVESIRRGTDTGMSRAHCAVGLIRYANGSHGYLIYLKASLTGDEQVDVQQYRDSHPQFPHETTADQFFAEDQFESYRRLGYHIATESLRGAERDRSIAAMAARLQDVWIPASAASAGFSEQTEALVALWDRMRSDMRLHLLFRELHGLTPPTTREIADDELLVCLEVIQLMENAYLNLQLDDFWSHPDNRGWVQLYTMWAQSPVFRAAWMRYRSIFGGRFIHFCEQRLGM